MQFSPRFFKNENPKLVSVRFGEDGLLVSAREEVVNDHLLLLPVLVADDTEHASFVQLFADED